MADVTANKVLETKPRAGRDAYQIANAVTLYEGALVGLEAGFLNHWADGATDVFLGILIGGDDRLNDGVIIGNTSDAKPPEGFVNTEGPILMHLDSVAGTPTQAKVGDPVFSATSNTDDITLTKGSNKAIGRMVRFRSATDVDVQLFTMWEFINHVVLTDNTGGTADDTLALVEATYTQATVANNFADLARKVNQILQRI